MTRRTEIAWLWLAVAITLGSEGTSAKDREKEVAWLQVSVFNDANVSPEELEQAERVASRVYAHSEIALVWLNCGRPAETREERAACSETSFPNHLHVRIRSRSLNLKESTFGLAYLGETGEGCYAEVFYAGVAQLEEADRTGSGTVLGLVMAHELGHLLLGTNSHAATGLMQPVWNAGDLAAARKGRLVFTEQQSERLRARLNTR